MTETGMLEMSPNETPQFGALPAVRRQTAAISGSIKAAIFCVAMGEDVSSEIFKYLDEAEVQVISRELANLQRVSSDTADSVIEELHQLLIAQSYVASGGADYAKRLLVKTYGSEPAKRLLDRINRETTVGFEALQKVDPQQLSKLFQNEHPQTIALVLAHLDVATAAATLEFVPEVQRADIILRMSNLQAISQDVIRRVSKVLDQKLKSVSVNDFSRQSVGGVRSVAEICNRLDREASRKMLEEIEGASPELALAIRNLMVTFDDLLLVDDIGIREILNRVDKKVLTLALKGTTPELQMRFFGNMSAKAVEMMKEEMEFMGQVKVKDVSNAQREVVEVLRELDEQGVVNLSGDAGGEDAYVS